MRSNPFLFTAGLALSLCLCAAAPRVQAQTLVDHWKAINGTVVSGDAAGYPITLSQPGHYKLTSDLWVPKGVKGITVSTDNVTIDLNGYTLRSKAECARYMGQPDLITCYAEGAVVTEDHVHGITTNRKDLVVRNGRIRGFTGHGIWASGAITLTDVALVSNVGSGAKFGHVSSQTSRLTGVAAEMNAGDGLQAQNALILNSVFTNNGRHGVQASRLAIVNSSVRMNVGRGVDALTPSTLLGTTMLDNAAGATAGPTVSLGGNFNGVGSF